MGVVFTVTVPTAPLPPDRVRVSGPSRVRAVRYYDLISRPHGHAFWDPTTVAPYKITSGCDNLQYIDGRDVSRDIGGVGCDTK